MEYIVKRGDTLAALAARHGVTLPALLAANPSIKNANLIFIGQRLQIPGAAGPVVDYGEFVKEFGQPPPVPKPAGSAAAAAAEAARKAKEAKERDTWIIYGGVALVLVLILTSRG